MYSYVGEDPVNRIDPTGKTCTMNDGKADCKVDDPGKMSKKEIAHVEKAYTKAVNNLLKNPNKTHDITVKGKTFTVTSGNLANSLMKVKVIGGGVNSGARASTRGGTLDKSPTESGGPEITINKNAISQQAMSNGYEDRKLGQTFIHESIHTDPGESIFEKEWNENSTQFNNDHRDAYNRAAYDLY